jgi:inorganic triphosphatase YgiF
VCLGLILGQALILASHKQFSNRFLEVELLPQTSEETLTAIVGCLQDGWHLKPEPLSKFERALVLLDVL